VPSNSQSNAWAVAVSGHASSAPAGKTGVVDPFLNAGESELTLKLTANGVGDGVTGLMLSTADWVELFNVAEMVALTAAATCAVPIENDPLVAPLLTVTLPGTLAAALLLKSDTDVALDGAALRVTVP
jgi:hypothetical protein